VSNGGTVIWHFTFEVEDEQLAVRAAQAYQRDEWGCLPEHDDWPKTLDDAVEIAVQKHVCGDRPLPGLEIKEESFDVTYVHTPEAARG
jgi:hypothetical protein